MIKNLIFDFGKVLVDYDFSHVINQFFTDKKKEEEFYNIFASLKFLDICDKEDKPFSQIMQDMRERYPQYAKEAMMYEERYMEFVIGEIEGMRAVLTEMKKRGYKLYGLTNWCSMVHKVMKKYKIFSLLDGRVISSEEHIIKPDVAIYNRLLEKYGLKPEECVFTDDKPVNIIGAQKVGMKTILFENATQYKRELEKIIESEK